MNIRDELLKLCSYEISHRFMSFQLVLSNISSCGNSNYELSLGGIANILAPRIPNDNAHGNWRLSSSGMRRGSGNLPG